MSPKNRITAYQKRVMTALAKNTIDELIAIAEEKKRIDRMSDKKKKGKKK